ncbi:hypothetical protein F5Y15DRAFT_376972, partial [Xylariaceae sp. FL0016]
MTNSDGLDTELYIAIVALLTSIVALSTTVLHILQQYFASKTGHVSCSTRIMENGEKPQGSSSNRRGFVLRFNSGHLPSSSHPRI